jgi:non-ribosomal peptide synthetase component F
MKLIQHGFLAQAEQRPEASAIAWKGERLAYGELAAASHRIAQLLHGLGCRRGIVVRMF